MNSKEKLSRELLREIRKNPEFREVNEKIGKDKKVIRRMEKGEYKQYTVKLLLQIAKATNTALRVEFAD